MLPTLQPITGKDELKSDDSDEELLRGEETNERENLLGGK